MKAAVTDALLKTLPIYEVPSQSLWRALELVKLREIMSETRFVGPSLEIGCGDGAFTTLLFDHLDDAIDINARAVERARSKGSIYSRVHLMDARDMQFDSESYGLVFANCVIEHIPSLSDVLQDIHRILRPGGLFITTVPLVEMNEHLLLRHRWYTGLRQRQLQHINLLANDDWKHRLHQAGFTSVADFPYLGSLECHLWDMLDFPICIGWRRYTVSAAVRILYRGLPHQAQSKILVWTASELSKRFSHQQGGDPCAVVLVSKK